MGLEELCTGRNRSDSLAGDGHRRGEGVKGVSEERVIAGDEGPLVLADVVHFATHVVVAANNVNLILEEEGLVRDSELVHRVQRLPSLAVHVEKMHFAISVRVFSANQNDFRGANCEGTTRPKRILPLPLMKQLKSHLPSYEQSRRTISSSRLRKLL